MRSKRGMRMMTCFQRSRLALMSFRSLPARNLQEALDQCHKCSKTRTQHLLMNMAMISQMQLFKMAIASLTVIKNHLKRKRLIQTERNQNLMDCRQEKFLQAAAIMVSKTRNNYKVRKIPMRPILWWWARKLTAKTLGFSTALIYNRPIMEVKGYF